MGISLNINIPKNDEFFEESPRNSLVSPKNITLKSLKQTSEIKIMEDENESLLSTPLDKTR